MIYRFKEIPAASGIFLCVDKMWPASHNGCVTMRGQVSEEVVI